MYLKGGVALQRAGRRGCAAAGGGNERQHDSQRGENVRFRERRAARRARRRCGERCWWRAGRCATRQRCCGEKKYGPPAAQPERAQHVLSLSSCIYIGTHLLFPTRVLNTFPVDLKGIHVEGGTSTSNGALKRMEWHLSGDVAPAHGAIACNGRPLLLDSQTRAPPTSQQLGRSVAAAGPVILAPSSIVFVSTPRAQ